MVSNLKIFFAGVAVIWCLIFVPMIYSGGPDVLQSAIGILGEGSVGLRQITMDSSTRSLCVMDYDHREIHGGFAFTVSSQSVSLGSGNTFNMLLQVSSSTRYLHITNQLESTGEGEIRFVEAPTISASGTSQTIFNRRRTSTRQSPVRAFIGCTFSGGTVLRNFRCGAGKTQGGSNRSSSEWVLKPSTNYVIQYTSRATGIFAELKSDWYEHEDKN